MGTHFINIVYLVAAVCFIFGLKGLTSPRTAPRGNLLGASGMLLAILATLLDQHILTFQLIIIGLVVGAAVGAYLALTVQMTAMPQMVAAFNGFGGGASALVAATALIAPGDLTNVPPIQLYVASTASGLIGAATFTGSMIAWAKLQGVLHWQPKSDTLQKGINASLAVVSLALAAYVVATGADEPVLTEREHDVLAALAAGRSRRLAAEQLHLSVNTVKTYAQQAYRALGVTTLTEAIERCDELGIPLDTPDPAAE